ncbi:MAG: RNA methyltransferase [Chloroflexi bacterium]|nr:RNA methyltransferase [Chloroflexota bacterium]
MTASSFQIMQCEHRGCGFRFPVLVGEDRVQYCPRCGGKIHTELPGFSPLVVNEDLNEQELPVIDVVFDNIRSAWNVGSMLRTADGAGIHKVHICGLSPTPENPKTAKTALGAERVISWVYHLNSLQAIEELQGMGMKIWALEGGPRSTPIHQAIRGMRPNPIALVIGNEVSGIDPEIINRCEKVISIPMKGFKRSLNVAVAFGIAIYTLRFAAYLQIFSD